MNAIEHQAQTSTEVTTRSEQTEQDMRAIQRMFERAANAIVEASDLGKTVTELRKQVDELLNDTNHLRERIGWLEQENVTLRTQRDESQDAHANDKNRWAETEALYINDLNLKQSQVYTLKTEIDNLVSQRDGARADAKMWEDEALKLETKLVEMTKQYEALKLTMDNIFDRVKTHYPSPNPVPEVTATSEFNPSYAA